MKQKSRFKSIPGIHIQWPWSQLILSGEKVIETRGYPLISKYIGQELAIIETAGPKGKKLAGITEARVVGTVIFGKSFRYENLVQWQNDKNKHLVENDDPRFSFQNRKVTWGWTIDKVTLLKEPSMPPKRRGIVFALGCKVLEDA